MNEQQISSIAETLNITLAEATALVATEVARKAAGERYRQTEAYKLRLAQQKLVRKVLKEVVL